MNIKPMLLRLQGALDQNDLVEKMVLLPGPSISDNWAQTDQAINLVVGYNGSPKSHTALDLTLWIAHQTRLATQLQVTVQVVYVVDDSRYVPDFGTNSSGSAELPSQALGVSSSSTLASTSAIAQRATLAASTLSVPVVPFPRPYNQTDSFEHADWVLWQARNLADEWRGSLKAHLRFGSVATELRKIVESESAGLLLLGCCTAAHPVVQMLGHHFPCPVLGIPASGQSQQF